VRSGGPTPGKIEWGRALGRTLLDAMPREPRRPSSTSFRVLAAAAVIGAAACRRGAPPPPDAAAAPPNAAARDAAAADPRIEAGAVADAGAVPIDPIAEADGDEETSAHAAKRTSGDLFALPADASTTTAAARCAAFEAAERAFFARVARSFSGPGKPPCTFEPPRSFGVCIIHENEAWALAFEELEITWEKRTRGAPPGPGQCDMRGRWAVAHVAEDGTVARISPKVFRYPNGNLNYDVSFWTEENSASVDLAPVFDFDGDGSIEVRVTASYHAHEAEPQGWDGVLTHRAGRIALYEPALRFREASRPRSIVTAAGEESDCVFRDVDGDGRPDIVHRPYRKRVGSVFGFSLDEIEDIPFVAHALPSGQFATDDDVARRFALTTCPARPKTIAVRRDGGTDLVDTARNVACARVWGDSAAAVLTGLGKACARYVPDEPTAEEHPPGTCVDWLAGFAKAAPPLTLSADAGL